MKIKCFKMILWNFAQKFNPLWNLSKRNKTPSYQIHRIKLHFNNKNDLSLAFDTCIKFRFHFRTMKRFSYICVSVITEWCHTILKAGQMKFNRPWFGPESQPPEVRIIEGHPSRYNPHTTLLICSDRTVLKTTGMEKVICTQWSCTFHFLHSIINSI